MQDNNKRLILAIVLCLLIVIGWSSFAQHMGWVPAPDPKVAEQQREMAQKQAEDAAKAQAEVEKAAVLPTFTPSDGKDVVVESPLYKAVFYTGGGILRSFELKKYHVGLTSDSSLVNIVDERTAAVAPMGLVINGQASWSTGKWAMESGDEQGLNLAGGEQGSICLNGMVDGMRIQRVLSFSADSYLITEKVRVVNESANVRSLRLGYTVAADSKNAANDRYDVMRIAWDSDGSLSDESSVDTLQKQGVMANGKIFWAGAMSTYFMATVLPDNFENMTVKGRVRTTVFRAALEEPETVIQPGTTREFSVRYWIGPKERKALGAVSEELARSVDLGMFSLIAKGLLWLLQIFYDYVQNWGVAIIMLTVVIKALFWPLTAKSYSSMEKMKKLQPHMMTIREKYKDNKEQMNKEIMGLYKTYGVNPASGCMPILIQLPVFFGLYQALLTAIELRHAPFVTYLPFTDKLWLADLSSKDPFYITPIIMGVTMFLQQKMSPPANDATQQKIMMFLPIIFTFLFLGFPSGLVIYWLANNVLSIFQQWLMIRKNKTSASAAK
ncbi:MAG: membrane protein insertase YidC [Desulfovibrio sp.]|nr:membrane protein insertase YidC [Desulfovibrio sp.]